LFYRSQWAFLTCSFGKAPSAYPEEKDRCDLYWGAGRHAIKELREDELIRGAIVRQELALTRFLPLKIRPHTHALVETHDRLDEEDIANRMHAYCDKEMGAINPRWSPRVKVEAIETEEAFKKIINYLYKPIRITYAYHQAWMRYVESNPIRAEKLNVEVNDFFAAYAVLTWGTRQVTYLGSFHHAWKRGFGY
jgi:hypothetical protein